MGTLEMCKHNKCPKVSSVIYPLEFGFKGRCLTPDSTEWYLMQSSKLWLYSSPQQAEICYMTNSAGEVAVVENTI